jgi:acetolactate synthase-1/3 small subunit
MLHTIIAYVENKPGVLNRVASLFRRRAYNIESLAVGHTHLPGVSRMTIMVDAAEEGIARRIEANLYKLVNVLRVDDLTHKDAVARELALVKVKANSVNRSEIVQIADIFRANIVDVAPHTLVLEITGTVEKVNRLLRMLEPFSIVEVQRTGVVAILRGGEEVSTDLPLVAAGTNGQPAVDAAPKE